MDGFVFYSVYTWVHDREVCNNKRNISRGTLFCFISGRHLFCVLPFLQEFSDLPTPCSALVSSSGSMADYVVGTVQ